MRRATWSLVHRRPAAVLPNRRTPRTHTTATAASHEAGRQLGRARRPRASVPRGSGDPLRTSGIARAECERDTAPQYAQKPWPHGPNGSLSPGMYSRSTPELSIVTRRIMPPDEPSRDIACATAAAGGERDARRARTATARGRQLVVFRRRHPWRSHSGMMAPTMLPPRTKGGRQRARGALGRGGGAAAVP